LREKICTKSSTIMKSNISRGGFDRILGKAEIFQRQIELAKRAAENDLPVLISGETGTGKDLVARAIHESGARRAGPFIAENCGAVPENLLEGVFFGTEKGAFTEAVTRPGLFEEADGGTLFLDELNSMPIYLQSKLLRALQEFSIRRIGGSREIPFDVRLITAVNETPESLMETGRLRKDLYYRINVIRIQLPPLRERKEDIPLYVEYFLKEANEKYGKEAEGFDSPSMDALTKFSYPGNVRELKNMVESAVALSTDEKILRLDMVRQL